MNLPSGANFEMRPIAPGPGGIEELRAVRFRHEDAAVGRDQHVVRLGELRRRIAGFARRAERHQHLALRAELDDGVSLAWPQSGNFLSFVGGRRCARRPPTRCPACRRPCRAARESGRRRSSGPPCRCGSSLTMGSTSEPAHELVPQRSPAQMCLPSASTLTALTEPHLRPSGSVPKLRTVSYGFGRLLTGVTLRARADRSRRGPSSALACRARHRAGREPPTGRTRRAPRARWLRSEGEALS